MIVKQAREIAKRWVREEGHQIPGFYGAFFHGSINWLSDDADLPASSDVDIMVVLAETAQSETRGKFLYHDVLLEVSYLQKNQVSSPEQILGNCHLAGGFRAPGILADPSGQLTAIQAAVSEDYSKRQWVRKRCDHAESIVLNFLQSVNESVSFHDQAAPWLFATGVTTHLLLVAGLKNPTVRRRYVDAKALLTEYGLAHFHETLLEILGCAAMRREQAAQHLTALTRAFDAARAVIRTPYRFAADISETGRPVAIDGSRELIERGLHREAVFWMAATYSRCQWVLSHDASPKMQEQYTHGYRRLFADLGIQSPADIQRRSAQVRESLPRIRAVAETIMAVNPLIED